MTDETTTLDQEVRNLASISDKPSLTALSYALRHPETWPEGFVWDYGNCNRCAVGLANDLWGLKILTRSKQSAATVITATARSFSMGYEDVNDIFFNLAPVVTDRWEEKVKIFGPFFRTVRGTDERIDWEAVLPDDVADAIDKYLEHTA